VQPDLEWSGKKQFAFLAKVEKSIEQADLEIYSNQNRNLLIAESDQIRGRDNQLICKLHSCHESLRLIGRTWHTAMA
jgi:hypothetical protein